MFCDPKKCTATQRRASGDTDDRNKCIIVPQQMSRNKWPQLMKSGPPSQGLHPNPMRLSAQTAYPSFHKQNLRNPIRLAKQNRHWGSWAQFMF